VRGKVWGVITQGIVLASLYELLEFHAKPRSHKENENFAFLASRHRRIFNFARDLKFVT
jgi:hypothetical protein